MLLEGEDPLLGVDMQSTGEVACFGDNFYDALLKAFLAAGYKLPQGNDSVLVSVGGPLLKEQIIPLVKDLQKLGLSIFATEHTADFLVEKGLRNVTVLHKISEPSRKPNLEDHLVNRKLQLIINIPETEVLEKHTMMLEDEYSIRRKAIELGIPVLTNFETASVFINGLVWFSQRSAVS
jgi:carbamoyl-phosphate synthase large subunit